MSLNRAMRLEKVLGQQEEEEEGEGFWASLTTSRVNLKLGELVRV